MTEKNEFSLVVRAFTGKSRPVQLLRLLLQMSESNNSGSAIVDLHLAVEGYSRQFHSNQINEELGRCKQVLLPLL